MDIDKKLAEECDRVTDKNGSRPHLIIVTGETGTQVHGTFDGVPAVKVGAAYGMVMSALKKSIANVAEQMRGETGDEALAAFSAGMFMGLGSGEGADSLSVTRKSAPST